MVFLTACAPFYGPNYQGGGGVPWRCRPQVLMSTFPAGFNVLKNSQEEGPLGLFGLAFLGPCKYLNSISTGQGTRP